jgi:hypothetical protein
MNNSVIIKAGSQFRPESRNGNTFDLTLDNSITVSMYPNARIQIGNTVYLYGPAQTGEGVIIPPAVPAGGIIRTGGSFTVDKNTKYHINNVEYDPIGLTKTLEYEQKAHFQQNTAIILPSETILHTLDNSLEFRLTKSMHCVYNV